jgi:hypothetical protein
MLSLLVLNRVNKYIKFQPAVTNNEIILSGLSKIFIENYLLKKELGVYIMCSTCLNLPCLTLFTAMVYFPICYGIPLYRTYNNCKTNTLQIIDAKKYIN